ncbi:MAG: 50S ribosomal protein L10 [Candidatus Bathyarchaeota archaeon]|nr:MAG: 50S ribosomal protein L10 [Candidatus Bathyarchaeota archaeon]
MSTSHTPQEKTKSVEEIRSLVHEYRAIGIASLQKVRAPQLQELRKKLRESAHFRVVKNTIVKRAINECKDKPKLEEIGKDLSGSNVFLFTNLNPFRLALLLEKSKVKTTARAGDIAAHDVFVPAGNTGLPPGPIISQLGAVGLPTRIEAGSVWVSRDTMVAKEGESIPARLATVLSKLGIDSVEIGLTIKTAYESGLVIPGERLQPDLEGVKRSIEEAHAYAFNLSLNTAYPVPENISLLIQTVHHEAYGLALAADIYSSETIAGLIRKAHMETLSLLSKCKSFSSAS